MKRFILDTGIAAFEYGRLAFELKTIGRPIGQNDIMIAAIGKRQSKKGLVNSSAQIQIIKNVSVRDSQVAAQGGMAWVETPAPWLGRPVLPYFERRRSARRWSRRWAFWRDSSRR
jgi:hypothetical protein